MLLIKYQKIFDGFLGAWRTDDVNVEIKDRAKPHSQRYYPVPHLYKETFKKELDRLEKLGVLEKYNSQSGGLPLLSFLKRMAESDLYLISAGSIK